MNHALGSSVPLASVKGDALGEGLLLRRYLLRRFPYTIFVLESSTASPVIVAVVHHRRRPGYWKDRLARLGGATEGDVEE